MGKRREGREAAAQLLFQMELNPAELEESFVHFWMMRSEVDKDARGFAESLAKGVYDRVEEIDPIIKGALTNYTIERVGVLDRNILRLAIYEMMIGVEKAQPAIVINEAIEIAKKFGGIESGKFVNGVLDRIRRENLGSNEN